MANNCNLKATVPSQVVANRVWDAIKKVDAQFADLHHEITTSGGADQPYEIKSGDIFRKSASGFTGPQIITRRLRKPTE